MPTPFYHLSVAEELLQHPALPAKISSFLDKHQGAFLFGNTAPDVQVVSGQPREATHFFRLPIRSADQYAWEVCLHEHPDLAKCLRMFTAQAAFLAGFLCHLQADWIWVSDVFVPYFGLYKMWGTFPQRLYLHNVLRSYLDRDILPALSNGVRSHLGKAIPKHWLSFVRDEHLLQWRDFLSGQLQPGAKIKTVDVFARRQGISPDEYYDLLNSEEQMDQQVFAHIPRESLERYRQRLVEANLGLLREYLGDL